MIIETLWGTLKKEKFPSVGAKRVWKAIKSQIHDFSFKNNQATQVSSDLDGVGLQILGKPWVTMLSIRFMFGLTELWEFLIFEHKSYFQGFEGWEIYGDLFLS